MLVLDGSPYAAIGIEVNVDYITAVAVDLKGEELLNWRRSFPGGTSGPGQAVVAMAALARRVVSRMTKEARQVLGLTVAVPGLVDVDGIVRVAPNLGWRDADLAGDLTKALRDPGFPVLVDNDANLAALAEHRFGPHRNAANLVYVTGEVGVGAGIVLDGRLRRGGQGYSGEIGHLELDPAGPVCRCGRRGCLEAVAGVGAILAHTAPDASPSDLELEIDEVVRRARNDDPEVLGLLENLGRHLGRGMAAVANLLNPEVVILGGYYVPLAPGSSAAPRRRCTAGCSPPAGRLPPGGLHSRVRRRRARGGRAGAGLGRLRPPARPALTRAPPAPLPIPPPPMPLPMPMRRAMTPGHRPEREPCRCRTAANQPGS